ncbi:hypothetical protein [Parasphingorhabdus sp.]|uniref:hypothetical protein n=1 Tax=Parasphingorhabdus sp. TaxID=2709688 RepID=UPI002F95755C
MIKNYSIKSVLAVFLTCFMAAPAFAYLDGATGSMILQALIGGTATAMVFGRSYIAKAKTFISGGSRKAKEAGKRK